uniref:Uncharacterized protein n=1 Tax=Chromera velia CCMP2878 TaxID=1169474 RepID=A0A0G4I2M8_9ALVE|eukprot:Cvel_10374.t1-p1 / transcript=Cvel_10374.t1 / gene=Cvel_10374 / organism=Chromera_velia_CCMP2878 / gene_product=hypothetical protein / transcript_product=hypothetical protein / location=Cvel_scaffold624:71068-71872(-) / protein_length=190 / sequence_SO=supercontig / SO=protein_coding / is_pseudo=false
MWHHLERIHFAEFNKLKRELEAAATLKGPSDSFSSTPKQVAMTEFIQRIMLPAMMQQQMELLVIVICTAAVSESFLFYFKMFIMNFFMTYRLLCRQTMASSVLKAVTMKVNQAFLKKMAGYDSIGGGKRVAPKVPTRVVIDSSDDEKGADKGAATMTQQRRRVTRAEAQRQQIRQQRRKKWVLEESEEEK